MASIALGAGGGALVAVGLPIVLANPSPAPETVALRVGPAGAFLTGTFR